MSAPPPLPPPPQEDMRLFNTTSIVEKKPVTSQLRRPFLSSETPSKKNPGSAHVKCVKTLLHYHYASCINF